MKTFIRNVQFDWKLIERHSSTFVCSRPEKSSETKSVPPAVRDKAGSTWFPVDFMDLRDVRPTS